MSSEIFRPMLADDAVLDKLRFPLLASPKLDGIRAVVRSGVVGSRSNKAIPNEHVQRIFGVFEHFDGELIVGDPTSKTCFRDTTSVVMSDNKDLPMRFYVFDHVQHLEMAYLKRQLLITKAKIGKFKELVRVPQYPVGDLPALLLLEARLLDEGYEGLILRDANAPYKCGRSTVNEGYLLKLKRFVDAEFEVVGFEERMHNENIATTNELGRTKRSSHKENKSGLGDLGALVLRNPNGGTFNCGTGFDDKERDKVWRNRSAYLGKLAKIKYFAVGMKDAPRHPVFLGWRDRRDT